MSSLLDNYITPDSQWKQAASQEGVDYDAVMQSFMDQSYGVVANKAKVLFQDPFRLGFEIVHRNEKATKMVGLFAFRVNKKLYYAPVFFVNGEVKPADMLYRADVKRFVPLSEEWCDYLVRGVSESSGDVVDKGRQRQADAYMDRLAYPQRVKYAAAVPKGWKAPWWDPKQTYDPYNEGFEPNPLETNPGFIGMQQKNYRIKKMREAGLMPDGSPAPGAAPAAGVSGVAAPKTPAALPQQLKSPKTGLSNTPLPGMQAAAPGFKKSSSAPDNTEEMDAERARFSKAARDGSLWREILTHCADNTPMAKVLPRLIDQNGPDVLEKVADWLDGCEDAQRFLVEHYSEDELSKADTWLAKEAAQHDPEANAIVIVTDPAMSKSAAEREGVVTRGYHLVDNRPREEVNVVIEEIKDGAICELSSTCVADVMMESGEQERALLLLSDPSFLVEVDVVEPWSATRRRCKPDMIYFPKDKTCMKLGWEKEVFGDEPADVEKDLACCGVDGLSQGKHYIALHLGNMVCSSPFKVAGPITKDGECCTVPISDQYGCKRQFRYAPDRRSLEGGYVSDDTVFLEVKVDEEERGGDSPMGREFTMKDPGRVLMSAAGMDRWIRTAGDFTTSSDVHVKRRPTGGFDLIHKRAGEVVKVSRDLGMLEAHLELAEDFCLTCDKAGEILNKAVDRDVAYRVFDTVPREKRAYVTRMEGMEDWIHGFDPEIQVRLDAPQRQILSTFTPRRSDQVQRYGDHWERHEGTPLEFDDGRIPDDAVFNRSPEELAQMAEAYQLPHIFDHGCLGQLAKTNSDISNQIRNYIPDVEAGLDRNFRILFLLRYRPSDFEEMYGRDALMEMEQDLTDLAKREGESLLRLLKRFDGDSYPSKG